MKQDLLASLRAAVVALLAFTVLTGILYPLVVTGIGQVAFSHQASGASELIGQTFTHPGYLWGRPSAVSYNAMTSSGTNLGMSPALHDAVAVRVKTLQDADPGNTTPIPVDLVTASASGLDPHVSPAAAYYQVGRIAKARGLSPDDVRTVILGHTTARTLGFLGEPRVNVVAVNRALDARTGPPR
ncbi:MAG: potassium-transporting ATPase subunit KdpC [Kofleriaceae bacterium]